MKNPLPIFLGVLAVLGAAWLAYHLWQRPITAGTTRDGAWVEYSAQHCKQPPEYKDATKDEAAHVEFTCEGTTYKTSTVHKAPDNWVDPKQ